MTKLQKITLFILRILLGWFMFYAGISKILVNNWSAEFYIKEAKTFASFYNLFLDPSILPIISSLNKWGIFLIGVSLVLGLFSRISSIFGIILMILYYFPILKFPYAGNYNYIVDNHIIFIAAFLLIIVFRVGRIWGLDRYLLKIKLSEKCAKLRECII